MPVKVSGGGASGRGSGYPPAPSTAALALVFPGQQVWIPGTPSNGTAATSALAIGQIWTQALIVGRNCAVDQLAFNVTVLAGAGGLARIGLYAADPLSAIPTKLLAGSGAIATDVGLGAKAFALPAPIALSAGTLYWLAYFAGVSAPTISTFNNGLGPPVIFGKNAALTVDQMSVDQTLAFQALPDPFLSGGGALLFGTGLPYLFARVV